MKKNGIVLFGVILALTSCGYNSAYHPAKQFGEFTINGYALTEYADEEVDITTARAMLSDASVRSRARYGLYNSNTPSDQAAEILGGYSGLSATTTYFVEGDEKEHNKVDIFRGTDFQSMLITNLFEPHSQMVVQGICANNELLDWMEDQNASFQDNPDHVVAPFKKPYTFHAGVGSGLIVQSHAFAELPASVNGGIGATFRQDCEYVFDYEGKISIWQSSLGIMTASPSGTLKQGMIFQVSFEWIAKE